MRAAALFLLPAVVAAALPAAAEPPPSLDIQARRPLPAGTYAVDLPSDSALGQDLRRMVIAKLAARGHQVAAGGRHVMRLQVDLTRRFDGGLSVEDVLAPPRNQIPSASADIRAPMPERPLRDLESKPRVDPETLRLTLTVQAVGSGDVIWVAWIACPVRDGRALGTGRAMIDTIFASPNRSRRGQADCPA